MERAILFIDGNNFYHGCVGGLGFSAADYREWDFIALAEKLAGPNRRVAEVRHYIGQVRQEKGDSFRYERQRRFIRALERDGVVCLMGRLEKRGRPDENAGALMRWLAALPGREFKLERRFRRELEDLSRQTLPRRLGAWLNSLAPRGERLHPQAYAELHRLRCEASGAVWVEKAVDVMIAVDMISMAHRDAYDAAYLLSADGDFTPAVDEVRDIGKKVFAASPLYGAALAARANAFISMKRDFFAGLWRENAPVRG